MPVSCLSPITLYPRLTNKSAEKFEVAPIALSLNEAFGYISLAFGNLRPLLDNFHVSQYLIQAITPGSSPLLQLPYFDAKLAKSVESEQTSGHLTVQEFMKIPEEKRHALTVGAGLLSEQKYAAVISVARQIPVLEISKAFFKVVGEKVITPSSLVQLVVKARFVPPGSTNVPEVSKADLEDIDPDEDDIDAFMGRKSEGKTAGDGKTGKSNEALQPPLAYAPYLCRDYSPQWQFVLGDPLQGKMAVPPFHFNSFDKPIFDEAGNYTYNVQTLRMQFQGPPQVGDFGFTLYMLCDSYIGLDSQVDVILSVEDQAKAVALEEDDISEPDEGKFNGF